MGTGAQFELCVVCMSTGAPVVQWVWGPKVVGCLFIKQQVTWLYTYAPPGRGPCSAKLYSTLETPSVAPPILALRRPPPGPRRRILGPADHFPGLPRFCLPAFAVSPRSFPHSLGFSSSSALRFDPLVRPSPPASSAEWRDWPRSPRGFRLPSPLPAALLLPFRVEAFSTWALRLRRW